MYWIALKMLTGDRAKFFGIVLGLTFSALLIAQQGSIFCGLMRRTSSQIFDIRGADLWVMDPNVRFIDDVKPMIETSLYRVRGVDGVQWAVPLYKGIGRVKISDPAVESRKDPVVEQVILLGLDDASLVGAPPPEKMIAGALVDLRRPEAIIVDFTRLPKLFPKEQWSELPKPPSALRQELRGIAWDLLHVGRGLLVRAGLASPESLAAAPDPEADYRRQLTAFYRRFLNRELEMNDHRAVIVGVCEATRTFQSNAVVYTTYSRAKQFVPAERKPLTYVLAKAAPGVDPQVVARRIAAQTGLKASSSAAFIEETIRYFIKYTGIPVNFGITAALGFLVGTAIAGQTFYNFTLENLKQFGALKAMGAGNLTIVNMILLQAAVTGLIGYGLGMGLAALFGVVTKGGELAYYMWWPVIPITGAAIVLICVLSSILSVRKVIVLEPAIVFRG